MRKDGSPPKALSIAVVVPVLNEGQGFTSRLDYLVRRLRPEEIIIVDGGQDSGLAAAVDAMLGAWPDAADSPPRLIQAAPGRARQMNAGAASAHADIVLFLHADTELPATALARVREAFERSALWGRFDVRLSGGHAALRVIERMMNWRSRISGTATGDQAIFVRRDVFKMLGGYTEIELMEDIELCDRLKWVGRPACLRDRVVTSSRRWEQRGILRTVLLMWMLRLLYRLGVSPKRLARWYK